MEGDNRNNQDTQNNYQDYTSDAQYQQTPVYQQAESPKSTNTLAIVGMILGIISILAGCCGWYGLIFAIPGLICSILSRKNGKSGMATAGIVCSIVGIVIAVLMTILAFGMVALMGDSPEMQDLLRQIQELQ